MGYTADYAQHEPDRAELDATEGALLLEFGSPACGHCRRAQPLLEAALGDHPEVGHLKIEDGPGRRLGRSFTVKLWPTLVFIANGEEVARLVRPQGAEEIRRALERISPGAGS